MLHSSWVRTSSGFLTAFILVMVRSPGFGLCACYLMVALIRLAFAVASFPQELNRQHTAYSLAHSSIGTVSPRRAPPPCKHMVSETISSPSRAAFQLSITVLVHYRLGRVFSLAASSRLLPTGFLESCRTLDYHEQGVSNNFAYGTITVFGPAFQPIQLSFNVIHLESI